MSVLDKFLDAIRLNDDYEEEDADSDSFFDEEDDDIEEKPKKRFFRKLENEDEDEEEEPQAKSVHTAPRKQPAPKTTASSQAGCCTSSKASCSGFPESYSNEKESRCIKYGSMRHQTGFHGGYP